MAHIAMCCQDGRGRFPVYRTSSPNLGKSAKKKKTIPAELEFFKNDSHV